MSVDVMVKKWLQNVKIKISLTRTSELFQGLPWIIPHYLENKRFTYIQVELPQSSFSPVYRCKV